MSKAKFQFNPKTLSFERIDNTIRHKLSNFMSHIFSGLFIGIAFFAIFFLFLRSKLESKNNQLETQYRILNSQLEEIQEVLTDIQLRDDQMYRVILQAEPIDSKIRRGNYQSGNYIDLQDQTNMEIAVSTTKKIDEIRRQLYIQSVSFDEVVNMIKNKEEMLQCIPAIQPVMNKDLRRMASGYGMRIDPIYKTPKFHAGMDFSGDTGTEIFATGDGVVEFQGWQQGYGNTVIINHGYGYKTLYAHLNGFVSKQRVGKKVKRGDVIAYMGNTGKSTGPHLHYEVHYRGKVTDPRNHYYMDLSPEQYDEMIQITSNSGQVFD